MSLIELRRMEEANKVSNKINTKIIQLQTIVNYEKNPDKTIQKLKDEVYHLLSIHTEMKSRINNSKGNFGRTPRQAVEAPQKFAS